MKKLFLLFVGFLNVFIANQAFAQYNKEDIFKANTEITWLGVDFSEVKFIGPATGWGDEGTKSPTEMRDKYFPAWNELILSEPKNFKVAEAVSKLEVSNAIEITADANAKMNKKEIFSETISDFQLLSENVPLSGHDR